LVYGVVFAVNGANMLADATTRAALPRVVEQRSLVQRANAMLVSQQGTVQAIAGAVGAVLVALLSPGPIFWFDALTFLLSMLILVPFTSTLNRQEPGTVRDPGQRSVIGYGRGVLREAFHGTRVLFGDRLLRLPILTV